MVSIAVSIRVAAPPINSAYGSGSPTDAFLSPIVIAELLEKDPDAHAPVIAQRLNPLGFDGGTTIIKDYLRALRKTSVGRRAYVRVEPARRTLRRGLGPFRRARLQRRDAQALRLLPSGGSQPEDVSGVHA